MSVVDIIIIALLVLFALLGFWKGLQKSALSLGAFVIAFIIAFFLSNVIAEALLGIEGVRGFVFGHEEGQFSLYNSWVYPTFHSGDSDKLPSEFIEKNFYTPILELAKTTKSVTTLSEVEVGAICSTFNVFSAIVGVVLFLLVRALLCIATMIIKSYIPQKKSILNRLLGVASGAVRGFVWALAITVVLSVFTGLPALKTIEDEYESGGMGNGFNTMAYGLKNKFFLPSSEMLDRIIQKAGFTQPDVPDEPETTDPLSGEKNQLLVDLTNHLYAGEGRYTISEDGQLHENNNPITEFDKYQNTDERKAAYDKTGFDEVFKAILDYNNKVGDKMVGKNGDTITVNGGILKDATKSELDNYSAVVTGDIYDAINSGSDGFLPQFTQYFNIINDTNFGKRTDQAVVDGNNEKLRAAYDKMKASFTKLVAAYNKLGDKFITVCGSLVLPTLPECVQETVVAG